MLQDGVHKMVKKLSRGQKAWATRKANAKIMHDVLKNIKEPWKVSENQVGPASNPAPILTLCGQLEDIIILLETRISNSIAKINSLL